MMALVAVIEATSFTEAARRLETTKSVMSKRVSDLERELGASLLDRNGRSICPTEVGAVYYAKCVRILESIAAANDFVANFNNLVRGTLRVAVSRSFGDELVMSLLNRFATEYPDVHLDVRFSDGSGTSTMEPSFDVVINSGEPDSADLVVRPLIEYRYAMCASPMYLQRRGTPLVPEDLRKHDALLDGSGEHGAAWRYREADEWRPYAYCERMRSSCGRQLVDAACAGLGIVMAPQPLVADKIAEGSLQEIMPDFERPDNRLLLMYPKSRRNLHKVQKLLGFLTQAMR